MKKIFYSIALIAMVFSGAACSKTDNLESELAELKKELNDLKNNSGESEETVPLTIKADKEFLVMCADADDQRDRTTEFAYTIEGATGDVKVFAEWETENPMAYMKTFVIPTDNKSGVVEFQQPNYGQTAGTDGLYLDYPSGRVKLFAYSSDGRSAVTEVMVLGESWYFEFYGDEMTGNVVTFNIPAEGEFIDYCYVSRDLYDTNWKSYPQLAAFEPGTNAISEFFYFTYSSGTKDWATISVPETPIDKIRPGVDGMTYWSDNYPYTLSFKANSTGSERTGTIEISTYTMKKGGSSSRVTRVKLKFVQPSL